MTSLFISLGLLAAISVGELLIAIVFLKTRDGKLNKSALLASVVSIVAMVFAYFLVWFRLEKDVIALNITLALCVSYFSSFAFSAYHDVNPKKFFKVATVVSALLFFICLSMFIGRTEQLTIEHQSEKSITAEQILIEHGVPSDEAPDILNEIIEILNKKGE